MRHDVTLYGHWICPYATRVAFALAHRGIDHDIVEVPPSAVRGPDFVLPLEFVVHSPRLEIPMLRIGQRYLADSIPILEWMDEILPGAPSARIGADAAEQVRSRVAWVDREVFGPMIRVYYGHDAVRIRAAAERLSDALGVLDRWLGVDPWLAGGGPTRAEAVLLPFYVRLDGLRRLGFTAALPATVDQHRRRCEDLAGWDAVAWSTEQTDEFVGRFEAHRRRLGAAPA